MAKINLNNSIIEPIACCLIEALQKAYVSETADALYGCLAFETAIKVDEISRAIFNKKEIIEIGIKESKWAIEQLIRDRLVGICFEKPKDDKLTVEALIRIMVGHVGTYMNVSKHTIMSLRIYSLTFKL